MGEFIIAVLIVSVLWIMWDVAKLALSERYNEDTVLSAYEPGRERMEKFADSFARLAETFRNMPSRKERFTEEDIKGIFGDVQNRVCSQCSRREQCWEEHYYRTYRRAYGMLQAIEEEGEEINQGRQEAFMEICIRGTTFMAAMLESFRIAKLNLMWSNRLLENREAVAGQLYETADIMKRAANSIYDISFIDPGLEKQIQIKLRMHGVIMKEIWGARRDADRLELFVTMQTNKKGRCVATREIATLLSEACNQRMVPDRDSRTIVNRDLSTIYFVAEPAFAMLNGVAKVTKEGELVSGDNFAMFRKENGQMIMSLSDGMGSGVGACQESETVIELLEQFLGAGFGKETAVRMIHSTMLLQNTNQIFSTVDLCMVDLYNGECELLKIGASTTFLRRQDWVESITSTSLPIGVLQTLDYESTKKQLEPGDFIIMVSDGVLDALPAKGGEDILKEVILEQQTNNAQEMAKAILQRVLLYQHCKAIDDMTVLVGGLWRS